ncbi:MAG: tyrosine-type recombinase/integrase [Acidobacteriia bacterium]|nr:tyrosine-type recombinase/integrase [Terriglobia bacterium]
MDHDIIAFRACRESASGTSSGQGRERRKLPLAIAVAAYVASSSWPEFQHGHPHRFRDIFAVELLLAGVPLERVSILLGHSSIRITEKHYSPWIRARQEQLEADLERSWITDPVVLAATKGTPEVHEKKESAN